MSDYTNKELLEAIYEVRDRVTRIEEKLNRAEKMEDKVELAFEKAQEAKEVGDKALLLTQKNAEEFAEEIKAIKSNNKWAWGFVLTLVVGVVSAYFGMDLK